MTERRRRIAFGGAAAVLAGSALLLTLLSPAMRSSEGGPKRPAGTTEIRTGSAPVPPPVEEPGGREHMPGSTPVPPTSATPAGSRSREREARRAPAVEPRQARAAITAARRFLDGYLLYSYGRARATRIRAAAALLMRDLDQSPPRVPAAVARADPGLVSVHAEATLGGGAIEVLAVVDDGRRRYRVPLELRTTRGHWVVTAVGG